MHKYALANDTTTPVSKFSQSTGMSDLIKSKVIRVLAPAIAGIDNMNEILVELSRL